MAYSWVINYSISDSDFDRLVNDSIESLRTSFVAKTDNQIKDYLQKLRTKMQYNITGFKDDHLVMYLNGTQEGDTYTFANALYGRDASGSRSFLHDMNWHIYAGNFLTDNNITNIVQPGIENSTCVNYLETANTETGCSVAKETKTEGGLKECKFTQSDFKMS